MDPATEREVYETVELYRHRFMEDALDRWPEVVGDAEPAFIKLCVKFIWNLCPGMDENLNAITVPPEFYTCDQEVVFGHQEAAFFQFILREGIDPSGCYILECAQVLVMLLTAMKLPRPRNLRDDCFHLGHLVRKFVPAWKPTSQTRHDRFEGLEKRLAACERALQQLSRRQAESGELRRFFLHSVTVLRLFMMPALRAAGSGQQVDAIPER
jgi:hypothetical protein